MSFKDVVGHQIIISQLKNAIETKRVGHAYLFSGPAGVGKKLTASNFAKAINCLNGNPDGCDSCDSCRKIDAFTHPDIRWYGPSGTSRTIKIEQVRDLSKNAYLMPYEAVKKVFIISDVDSMNPSSGNAVLKTLEEPPSDTVIILTTSFKDSILPTIRSRCQIVEFNPLPMNYIEDILRKRYNLAQNEARLYAVLSGGRIGRIETLLNGDYIRRRNGIIEEIGSGKFKSVSGVVSFVEGMIEDFKAVRKEDENRIKEKAGEISDADEAFLEGKYKGEIFEFIDLVYLFFRDIIIYKVSGKDELIINYDKLDVIKEISEKTSLEELENCARVAAFIKKAIAGNASLKLALEVMFLKFGECV